MLIACSVAKNKKKRDNYLPKWKCWPDTDNRRGQDLPVKPMERFHVSVDLS